MHRDGLLGDRANDQFADLLGREDASGGVTLDVYGDHIPEEDGGAANNLPEPPAPERAAEAATNVVPLRRRSR
ncbi:hypothetical protein [Mycobacterium sp.]|uniref:hypothetical protein n=1 Tax=Mycobacterium sp. TaxID=1785 RepID=UPI002C0D0A9D|nr:hypothetical protein [Mycobacterium sp.]HTY31691.1 hypothetical protein [Mycobacterium sp.]